MTWKPYLFLFFLLFVSMTLCMPTINFGGDAWCWFEWSKLIFLHGMGKIYHFDVNYHPIWLYVLYVYGHSQGSVDLILQNVNFLKTVPLLFDFLGALSVFLFVKFRRKNLFLPFFLLFNIAYTYNSIIWGQVDSIPTFFLVIAVAFALKEKAAWSLIALVLVFNTKLQTLLLCPVIGLLLLPCLIKKPQKIGTALISALVVQIILMLPFIIAGRAGQFWEVITGAIGHHPRVSMNAYNGWYLYFYPSSNPGHFDDDVLVGALTARNWGFLFFFSISFLVLLPLAIQTVQRIRKNNWNLLHWEKTALLCSALIPIVFFFFNTQMHERYTHFSLLFFFLYGLKAKNYAFYILCSAAYLFNMEGVLNAFPYIAKHTLIFDPRFIALIYLSIIIGGLVNLYRPPSRVS